MVLFAPMVVNMLGFKVNSVDNQSSVSVGPVQGIDLFVSYKRNQAFGEVNGDLSPVNIPIDSIMDMDVSDSNSVKNSLV